MKINNRRYIGNKSKLLDFIYEQIEATKSEDALRFFDVFAGTGVVASYFADKGYKVIVNDTLYSNKVAYEAYLGAGNISIGKIRKILQDFNQVDGSDLLENYFSQVYAHKYFSVNDAKKIGYIRDAIEEMKATLSDREYYYLITSLMYAADKIANTVGHFEHFLNREPIEKGVELKELQINENILPADIYNEDSNTLVKKIKCDIAYIDPPYNARQYINFYHVLENLARWNKPIEFEGASMKFKRNELKSGYCRKNKAKKLFEDLIDSLDANLIVVSYNNTYNAKSSSSNNTIMKEEIIDILSKKGTVSVKEIKYKSFNAGKTDFEGHREILYICEVNNEH